MTKRKYIKPLLEQINIDNHVSVLMVTTPPGGPGEGGDPLSISAPPSPFSATTPPSAGYSNKSPFGGSTPDYQ